MQSLHTEKVSFRGNCTEKVSSQGSSTEKVGYWEILPFTPRRLVLKEIAPRRLVLRGTVPRRLVLRGFFFSLFEYVFEKF